MRIIAGEARGKKLWTTAGRTTRPPLDHIRKSLFSILGDSFEGRPVLDLFAGVGAFGLEALSRGARRVVFVEADPAAVAALRRNVDTLAVQQRVEIVVGDAFHLPARAPDGGFALAFVDPPFKMFHAPADRARIYDRAASLLKSAALSPGAILILRQPSKARHACPLPVKETRVYGESLVQLFERDVSSADADLG